MLSLLVTAALVLAGCVGSSPPPASSDPPAIAEDRGAIEGTITDNELQPIPNAQVALQGSEDEILRTDAAGHFLIGDLEPATYTLLVSALGYEAMARPVNVQAAEVSLVSLRLAAVASGEPSSTLDDYKGFIACGTGAGAEGAGFTQVECGSNDPNQEFLFNYTFQRGLSGILIEMTWKPTQALSKDLVLILEKRGCGFECGVEDTYAQVQGCCRIRVFLEPDDLNKPAGHLAATNFEGKGGSLQSRTFPAFGESTTPLTVFTSQEFHIYAEYFYGGLPEDIQVRTNVPAQ